jgi:hypothetical protein
MDGSIRKAEEKPRSRDRPEHLPKVCRRGLTEWELASLLPALSNHGGLAQLVERLVRNEKARGSNPLTSTIPPSVG